VYIAVAAPRSPDHRVHKSQSSSSQLICSCMSFLNGYPLASFVLCRRQLYSSRNIRYFFPFCHFGKVTNFIPAEMCLSAFSFILLLRSRPIEYVHAKNFQDVCSDDVLSNVSCLPMMLTMSFSVSINVGEIWLECLHLEELQLSFFLTEENPAFIKHK